MTLRTTTSIFTIWHARTSMSRSDSRRTKCVAIPCCSSSSKRTSEMRLLTIALLHDGAALLRVERGRVVLEVLDQERQGRRSDRPAWLCPRREAHRDPSPSSSARANRIVDMPQGVPHVKETRRAPRRARCRVIVRIARAADRGGRRPPARARCTRRYASSRARRVAPAPAAPARRRSRRRGGRGSRAMASGRTSRPSTTPARRASMKSSTMVASGAITRSTDEWLMSRSCQSAMFSSAASGVAAHEAREAAQVLGQDRVPLVRHRRGALLPAPERLERLAHLGALQMADLERDALARRPPARPAG